ncbi:MAG: CHASE2 domain-containing protein [Bdellovibrionaceae bacterium]|nr:CHASE2 domain-containing protein [Bdellovibrio sp.]
MYSKRGFWTRALLCWVFALFFLKFDENGTYDIRFRLRGAQKSTQEIVLVTLKTSDFTKIYDLKTSSLINTNELSDLSDSFYWDRKVWVDVLSKILAQNPRRIGVTLYLGDNIGQVHLTSEEIIIFKDKRIFWATNSSEPEKLSLPLATRPDRSNLGHVDALKDDDGVTRRLFLSPDTLPNIAQRLVGLPAKNSAATVVNINYKGTNLFKEVSVSDVMNPQFNKDFFKDKIVIIGSEKSLNSQLQTPLGQMSRHEFWGQITENILSRSFIKKLSGFVYAFFLFLLTLLAVLVITHYPQTVALFFFVWMTTAVAAFSAWIFDSFAIWVPVVSSISLFILIWVLFIGYQALKIEQAHSKLQQEQSYFAELEQLKNNFVSLISHDLKTPIAKIQAVLDRVLTQSQLAPELHSDLSSLKIYSEELNRYIQSILKVLRVESREFKILKETADINGIIENVVDRLKPLATSKKIQLEMTLEPMFLIELDVTLMTEVFLNIIENAIKYTPDEGFVKIKSFESETEVFVEIADSGEGIQPEDQDQVWKKFVRGKSQDHKTKGTGLGLYLVKYFIELHGGRISLQSELGKGTTFFVRLPLETDEVAAGVL